MPISGFPASAPTPPNREDADLNRLLDVKNRIKELLSTTLDHASITVMQEKLLLKQRSSFCISVHREDHKKLRLVPIKVIAGYLGLDRLQWVKDSIRSDMKVCLVYLKLVFQDITIRRQNLEAFVAKCEQVKVDADEVSSTEQQLQLIQEHIRDFEEKIANDLKPPSLASLFFLRMRIPHNDKLHVSMVSLNPVMFHREKTLLTHNTVYLSWYIAGEQSEEPNSIFTVQIKTGAPEEKPLIQTPCHGYEYVVNYLQPDTSYTFIVKRMSSTELVYEPWVDTLYLKTPAPTAE